jgi:hypothetical protein
VMGHRQIGVRGFSVSSPDAETRIPPIVIGNKHDQQISVMGLTNLPTQLAWTEKENKLKNTNTDKMITPLCKLSESVLDLTALIVFILVAFAFVFKNIPSIPEPSLRIKSPFGKLPFFDGIIWYGGAILLFLLIMGFLRSWL